MLSSTETRNLQLSARSGASNERLIISLLNEYYRPARFVASSSTDNIHKDIDAIGRYGAQRFTYSIKSGTKPEDSGFIAFETEVVMNGKTQPSWFYRGEADFYLFLVYNKILCVSCDAVHAHVDAHGFERTCQTRQDTVRLLNANHPHKGATVGLLSLETLFSIGMRVLCEVPTNSPHFKQLCINRYGTEIKWLATGKPAPILKS